MNLPKRVVTLLLCAVLCSAGGGIYALVILNGIEARQNKVNHQLEVLGSLSDMRKNVWHLSSLPAKVIADSSRIQEINRDFDNAAQEVSRVLDVYGHEIKDDMRPDWEAFLEKLRAIMPRAARGEKGIEKDLRNIDTDEHLQMDMVLGKTLRSEKGEAKEAMDYIENANKRIWTFLSIGLALGLVLSAEAYRETAQVRAQNLLVKKIAGTDPLTGLANRRSFDDAFSKAWTGRGPLSVVLFDIDHFKTYNDNFGHPEGDRLLRTLAGATRNRCPKESHLARWGGEEFVLLLPGKPLDEASEVAEELRRTVETLHETGPEKLSRPVTISLGIAEDQGRIGKPQDLLEKADKALYRAKQGGRNRWMAELS